MLEEVDDERFRRILARREPGRAADAGAGKEPMKMLASWMAVGAARKPERSQGRGRLLNKENGSPGLTEAR
jgi:hypothetical protein